MARHTIISTFTLLLLIVTAVSYGHIRTDKKKKNQFLHLSETNIGFYKEARFVQKTKNSNCCSRGPIMSNGIVVRMPIVKHFKAEVSLDYAQMLNYTKHPDQNKTLQASTVPALSVPVSIQYYFLPKKCKVQPYAGLGTVIYSDVKNSLSLLENGEIRTKPLSTKYISLFFTQGIIFEINPKIQISESVNFINENGHNTIGVNFGIGFKIP